MRRKRRNRQTWMPTLGGLFQASGEVTYFGGTFIINAATGVGSPIFVSPIVPDETIFPEVAVTTSLRDLTEGQDWFLKRIVGKINCAAAQFAPTEGTAIKNIIAAAAFFVARAKDDDPNVPDLVEDEYDPLKTKNVRQPWIWRRTWFLSNQQAGSGAGSAQEYALARNNGEYGSALDGPHLDAKTARRIRREERLWFVFNAMAFDDEPGTYAPKTEQGEVMFGLDYRILGSMRKSNNRSTF